MPPADSLTRMEGELPGTPDRELGLGRTSRVRWRATLPPGVEGPAAGLLLVLPGFGTDADPAYTAKLAAHAADRHGLAALDVDFHCRYARPGNGAKIELGADAFFGLAGLAALLGIDINGCTDAGTVLARLRADGRDFSRLTHRPTVRGTLVPPGGDYQNFGVMQALDVIAAVADLRDAAPADGPVIALGSSHGGYLAHMVHRLAPTLLTGIIDNSSYTAAPPAFVGLGDELTLRDAGLEIRLNTRTRWQHTDPHRPDHFGPEARRLRDVADADLLTRTAEQRAAAGVGPLRLRAFHCAEDRLAPATDKRRQIELHRTLGTDATLKLVTAADLDGRTFKTLDHGMSASLKGLLDLALPTIQPPGMRLAA